MWGPVNCFVLSAGKDWHPMPGQVVMRKPSNLNPERAEGMSLSLEGWEGVKERSSNCIGHSVHRMDREFRKTYVYEHVFTGSRTANRGSRDCSHQQGKGTCSKSSSLHLERYGYVNSAGSGRCVMLVIDRGSLDRNEGEAKRNDEDKAEGENQSIVRQHRV
jgi:hypothetical protein